MFILLSFASLMCKDLEHNRLRDFSWKNSSTEKEGKEIALNKISPLKLYTQLRRFTFKYTTQTFCFCQYLYPFIHSVPFLFLHFLHTIRHICMGMEKEIYHPSLRQHVVILLLLWNIRGSALFCYLYFNQLMVYHDKLLFLQLLVVWSLWNCHHDFETS